VSSGAVFVGDRTGRAGGGGVGRLISGSLRSAQRAVPAGGGVVVVLGGGQLDPVSSAPARLCPGAGRPSADRRCSGGRRSAPRTLGVFGRAKPAALVGAAHAHARAAHPPAAVPCQPQPPADLVDRHALGAVQTTDPAHTSSAHPSSLNGWVSPTPTLQGQSQRVVDSSHPTSARHVPTPRQPPIDHLLCPCHPHLHEPITRVVGLQQRLRADDGPLVGAVGATPQLGGARWSLHEAPRLLR
jgi:hypothetical protein